MQFVFDSKAKLTIALLSSLTIALDFVSLHLGKGPRTCASLHVWKSFVPSHLLEQNNEKHVVPEKEVLVFYTILGKKYLISSL